MHTKQTDYSDEREIEMSEIENEFHKKLSEIHHKFQTELAELKEDFKTAQKADEVRPVFPDVPHFWISVDGDNAKELGLSAIDQSELTDICHKMEARAYIIEEINKVNGKRGKFSEGYSNYSFEISKRDNLIMTTSMTNKAFHDDFYVNDYDKASKLCNDNDFFEAYKVYLNYK